MALDEARFREAESAFSAGEYRAAAEGFLAAAGGPGGEGNGAAYHMGGNALMRLRKYQHAVTVYQHALNDTEYPKRPAVLTNLGAAHEALADFDEAVAAFDAALEDPDAPSRYKALQGRGGALYKMRRYEEAASSYRSAAIDPDNRDPGKAYNNFGLCLMALGRPSEAVEAYKGALSSDGYAGKGKAAVNLGLAYAALGLHEEAVRSFDMAVNGYGHELSEGALAAYDASRTALGEPPRHEVVEGWRTGELPAGPDADPSAPPVQAAFGEDESRFFTATDVELKEIDREARRVEKAERVATRNPWARAAAIAVTVMVVVGALAAVFFMGYGYPTQAGTVGGMLGAYKQGRDVSPYWVAAPVSDVKKEMSAIPPTYRDATVESIARGAFDSKVRVTVQLDKGAPLHYVISLAREGVGWKVVGIDNDWGTAGGS